MDENDRRPVPNPRVGDLQTVGADDLHHRNLQARVGGGASARVTVNSASIVDRAAAVNDPLGRLREFRIGTAGAAQLGLPERCVLFGKRLPRARWRSTCSSPIAQSRAQRTRCWNASAKQHPAPCAPPRPKRQRLPPCDKSSQDPVNFAHAGPMSAGHGASGSAGGCRRRAARRHPISSRWSGI
jgi:hypothetical protein